MTEDIKRKLLERGYTGIHEYIDQPGEDYPDHNHTGEQLLFVTKGSMTIGMNGQEVTIMAGGEFTFPAGAIHSAKIGAEGCSYIVGEKAGP